MPLQPVAPTEVVLANQIAARMIQEVMQTAARINELRAKGIAAQPAVAAVAASTGPQGQPIPAQPARPAVAGVSAAAIDAALGEDNCALLDEIRTALGL